MNFSKALLVFILLMSVSAFGQAPAASSVTTEMRAAANEAYQKQDWKTAAERYGAIVKSEGKNAGANYRLGTSFLNLGRAKDALAPLETAMSVSPNAVFSLELARAYAQTGGKEKMYEVLEKSVALGGISAESLNDDKDFASMKSETKFAELVKKLDSAANPCRGRPEFRQFDFWIGEWLPKTPQGITVGTSSIQLILGSCIIFENWSTPVSSGKSFNVYDTRDGKWHQTWVDDKGLITYYVGGLVEGKMILDSETVTNGKKTIGRMTFSKLPNGDVRQHGENSTDDGKTWTTSFDFTYVRKI
ncbi:MAG: tetratricopeptide repeat protein [Pyrinomonadaceae bacterium]